MSLSSNRDRRLQIQTTRNELVIHWFNQVQQGNINRSILLMCGKKTESDILLSLLLESVRQKKNIENSCIVADMDQLQRLENTYNKNIILWARYSLDLQQFRFTKREFLICSADEIFGDIYADKLESLKQALSIPLQMQPDISTQEHLYYLQKRDPKEFIHNGEQSVRELLTYLIDRTSFCKFIDRNNIFFRGQTFDIENDLNLLKNEKVMTARLGIIIYKLAKLDADISTTAIGNFYRKSLGISSKNLSFKHWNITNVVCYDLKEMSTGNAEVEALRYEITKNLLTQTNLDIKTISEITHMPVDKVIQLKNSI